MQQKYFRSLLLLLVLNLLIKPFWILGIDRNVQLAVGISIYGLYNALNNASFWLMIILDPGLHTFTNRSLAQNGELLSKYFSAFIPLKLALAGLYLILSLCIGFIFGYDAIAVRMLGLLSINQVLASTTTYARANLAGLHLFTLDSIVSVMDRGLMIVICSFLLWGNVMDGPFQINWFIYAQTFAFGLTALVSLGLVYKKTKFFRPRIKFSFLSIVLRRSYPYALLTILMTLYTRVDSIMIERMLPGSLGAYQAGVYASAFRLLDAITMLAYLFANILLPVFSGMIKRKEPVGETSSMAFRMLGLVSTLLAIASFAYRNEIMTLLYHKDGAEPARVFGFLMASLPALCCVYIYGSLLTANGSVKFLNWVSCGGLIANIGLNLFLIPRYEALGAVVATLVTQWVVGLLQLFKAHKLFGMKLKALDVLKGLIFMTVAIVTFAFLQGITGNWVLNLVILFGLNLTFAFAIGLLQIKFFINILKFRN